MSRRSAANPTVVESLVPAVAYYRMSSDHQETSIPDQRSAVKRYALTHGYQLIGEYRDEGISGDATDRRFQFQRMIADASSGRFKAILVWDLSRLGRFDIVEGGFWLKPLRDARVKVVTLDNGEIDWNDLGGRIIWSVQQEGKHAFLRDLSRGIVRGKLELAKKKERLAQAPYGYKLRRRTLVPGNPEHVRIVRRIFAEYRRRIPLKVISRTLNRDGIRAARGGTWTPAAVRCMLMNRAYRGDFVWNVRQVGRYFKIVDREVVPVDRPPGPSNKAARDDWIVIPNAHVPLINPRAFDAVQVMLRKRMTGQKKRTSDHFVLTGLIRCGRCGASMCAHHVPRGRIAYRCATYCTKGMQFCRRSSVHQNEMVDVLLDAIERTLLERSSKSRPTSTSANRTKTSAPKSDVEPLQAALESLESRLSHASKRILEVDRDLLAVAQREFRELRRQRNSLKATLQRIEIPCAGLPEEQQQAQSRAFGLLVRLREAVRTGDRRAVAELFREFIDKVYVWTVAVPVRTRFHYQLERGVVHFRSILGDEHVVFPEGAQLTMLVPPMWREVMARRVAKRKRPRRQKRRRSHSRHR